MLSLYIHIPFCNHKCSYCDFCVLPLDVIQKKDPNVLIDTYVQSLCQEIRHWGATLADKEIKTIFFGGGTPSLIGVDHILTIMQAVSDAFLLEYVEEITIEVNPYPPDEILDFIKKINAARKKYPRVRRSIGLQSFDTKMLRTVGRQYSFPGVVDFLRKLVPLRKENNVFNFDFIAFGAKWSDPTLSFFSDFVTSYFADSFSIYCLELFTGSEMYHTAGKQTLRPSPAQYSGVIREDGNNDAIYEEFQVLKDMLSQAGYTRYELSNFSLGGKNCIHNRVYWEQGNYLGCGLQATSCMQLDAKKSRRTNTSNIFEYIEGKWFDVNKKEELTETDVLIERCFLGLRTKEGIQIRDEGHGTRDEVCRDALHASCVLIPVGNEGAVPSSIFVADWKKKITQRKKAGYVTYEDKNLRLSDSGMDVYNTIVTELLQEI